MSAIQKCSLPRRTCVADCRALTEGMQAPPRLHGIPNLHFFNTTRNNVENKWSMQELCCIKSLDLKLDRNPEDGMENK